MKSRSLLAFCLLNLVLFLILGAYIFFWKAEKLAYVDSAKLVNKYQGMLDGRLVYQKKAATWKANIDTLAKELEAQIVVYKKDSPKMTVKEKQLSEELIRNKQKQITEYQQALSSQAQEEDNKMTSDIIAQINTYIKRYGEANGYQIILAATEYGNLAYASEGLDITDKILEGLNKEYKGQ